MKKTPLRRKTTLKRTKMPLLRKKRSKVAKRASGRVSGVKQLKTKLWAECKRITRARHGYVCYTCGKPTDVPHTGHFITSSTCSVEMRYSLDNLRPQCYHCNINLSGNWVAYEKHLRADGFDTEKMKQKNEDTKGLQYDILWYERKLAEYRGL